LAARQYGYITRAQLQDLGVAPGAIEHRRGTGRLVRVHYTVYSLGTPRREPIARAAAAVLAGGPGAVLSHESAAALWGLRKRWPDPPEITVATDRRRADIRVHTTTTLSKRDTRTHLGIRTTSAARALLDIAPRLPEEQLGRAFNDGRLDRRLYRAELEELLTRLPSHPGTKRLRGLVSTATAAPTRSDWERDFPAFARDHGLPEPQLNAHVAGYEVDALFAEQRVIVELDSWEFHQDRRAFERDRRRDAVTLAAGYVTVRITWERLTNDPEGEARRLRRILEARTAQRG
jgi:very-short-patch-repair endonuclease